MAFLLLLMALAGFAFADQLGDTLPDVLGRKKAYSPAFYSTGIFLVSILIGLGAGLITGCSGAGGGFIIAPALMSAGIKIAGDLGRILRQILRDAELMYANDSATVYGKYGIDGRRVLFNGWTAAGELEKVLKKNKNFKEAKIVADLKKRAIEIAFNYYAIEPQQISDRWGTLRRCRHVYG